MDNLVAVVAAISAIVISFVYAIGRMQGSQAEKGKQNEQELEVVKDAIRIRLNSNPEQLRSKYKIK